MHLREYQQGRYLAQQENVAVYRGHFRDEVGGDRDFPRSTRSCEARGGCFYSPGPLARLCAHCTVRAQEVECKGIFAVPWLRAAWQEKREEKRRRKKVEL
jgi:hypothetical protein